MFTTHFSLFLSVFDMDKIQTVQQIKYYSFDCVVIVYGSSPRWFKTHIIQFNVLELSISNIFRGDPPGSLLVKGEVWGASR